MSKLATGATLAWYCSSAGLSLGAFELGALGGGDPTAPNSVFIQFSKAGESSSAGCRAPPTVTMTLTQLVRSNATAPVAVSNVSVLVVIVDGQYRSPGAAVSSPLSRPTSCRTCAVVKATEDLLSPPPPNVLLSALPAVMVATVSVSACERVGRQIACASTRTATRPVSWLTVIISCGS